DGEPVRSDLAGGAVDLDLGDHRNARAVALRIGDAAALDLDAGLVAPRRWPRLPAGLGGRRLDQRNVARILDVPQAGLGRIEHERRRDLVDEGLAREVDLRADRIAHMRRAPRRTAV